MLIREASIVWNSLRGVVCLYKSAEDKLTHVRNRILYKISKELNEMKTRPPIDYVSIEESEPGKYDVIVQPSLADDPMVVGPRYQMEDIPCSWANHLGCITSGIVILGIRNGTHIAKNIRENYPTRAYRISGVLGQAKDNFFHNGKVVERATYKHVKLYNIERFLSNMQASHQRKMFEICGLDIQSQAAYELASQGPIRPINSKLPIIYGMKCVHFDSPYFTIEIQCVNEYETYLKTLIHEIGIKLNTVAYCSGIQCIRHSCFTLEDALLRKDWDLQHLISNMEHCSKLLQKYDNVVNQKSAVLN